MIEPVSVADEMVRKAIAHRDARLEARLRELGPGWAIGFRLKQQPYPVRQQHAQQPSLDMEWEVHEMRLIDGKLVEALAGFQYFTLPAETDPLSGPGQTARN